MLKNKLHDFWNTDKFTTSWIISTNDLSSALDDIKEFAQVLIDVPGLPIDNNPDFYIVRRDDTKFICVEQIRKLQQFLQVSSSVSKYKFAVIYEADLMNLNSANSCLKILEETPKDSYIFLLTSYPGNIITTIKSRCHKLAINTSLEPNISESYIDFIKLLLGSSNVEKINYLQTISNKNNNELWQEFCNNSTKLLSNLVKYDSGSLSALTEEEISYLNKKNTRSTKSLIKRFDEIENLIKDTMEYDLDKRHMGILILECLV